MPPGEHRNSLLPGYKLHWYHIEVILGQGGFGITYLATDTNLNRKVAIKEYLPIEMAVRQDNTSIHPVSGEHGEQFKWGLERFISEAQTLARFKHPNIVRVLTVFRENNTAYMVMEYEQGQPMHEILKNKKTLTEEELKNILLPILDGLESVHKAGFIHRDIKPPNIYIREDNSPVLLDFGSARQSFSEITRTLTTMVSPGYAPFEQYVGKSDKQGPWTDIYGLGATLYRAVTGIPPADSMDRSEAILHTGKDVFVSATEIAAGKYSSEFLYAIDQAMAFRGDDRPRSIAEWREIFTGKITVPVVARHEADSEKPTMAAVTIPTESVDATETETGKQGFFSRLIDRFYGVTKKLIKWGLILFGVLIVIGILTNDHRKKDQPEQTITDETNTAIMPEEIQKNESADTEPILQEPTPAEQISALLTGAQKNIEELRLTSPTGDNALEKYRNVLAIEPGNQAALQGIDRIVEEYIKLMDSAINRNNLSKADVYLQRAGRVNPQHAAIEPARIRLERAHQSARVDVPVVEPVPDITPEPLVPQIQPETSSRIPEAERQKLESIRERLRLNPQDRQAHRELKELAKSFEQNIRQAMNDGDYDLAREYVYEVQSNTDEKSRANKRLNELLKIIDKKEKEATN
jgi:hypothetical protein